MTVPDALGESDRRIRLALLDDHELLLDSLSAWFVENAPEFDVVLQASTWMQMVHSNAFPTDLVIMDMQLPESVSIEARVRTCRTAGAKVIVLSALDSDADRSRALGAGAAAFLAKIQPVREVVMAARHVMGLDTGKAPNRAWRPLPAGAVDVQRPALSDAEREALALYAAGSTTKEVAVAMNVKYETAKTYLRRVREKYGKSGRPTSTRSDLTRRAAEDGYLV